MSDRDVDTSAFALSRIYGQGWTAAKKILAIGKSDVDATHASANNPYRGQEERSRWEKGFMDAIESRAGEMTVPGGKSWRPASRRGSTK